MDDDNANIEYHPSLPSRLCINIWGSNTLVITLTFLLLSVLKKTCLWTFFLLFLLNLVKSLNYCLSPGSKFLVCWTWPSRELWRPGSKYAEMRYKVLKKSMTMLSGPTFSAVLLFERHQPQWADIVNILLLLQFTNSLIVLVLLVIKKRKPNHNVDNIDNKKTQSQCCPNWCCQPTITTINLNSDKKKTQPQYY